MAQSNTHFQQIAPSSVPTPSAGYYAIFLADGTAGTTAGLLYKKDSSAVVTPVGTPYTDEQAQDAVGTILTNTSTVYFTYNDAGNIISARVLNPFTSRVTATSKSYVVADNGTFYERINGGSAMTDTLPTLAAGDDGFTVGVHNKGTTAAETITFTSAGGEVIGDVATSYVLNFACRQTFIWTGTKWLFGAGNANLTKSPTVAPGVGDFATYNDTTGRQLTSTTLAATKTALGLTGTNSGDVTLAAVASSPNANAATLTGQALNLQPASASFPGVITSAQFVVLNNTSGTNSGNVSLAAVGASPNANGATLTGQALNLELASASFPGLVTAAQFTKLANTSGTNTGDQTISLTTDVTGSGTGSFAATIAADAVTNAKLANMATATLKGRATAGTGDPEDLTASQGRTVLGLTHFATDADLTGDVTTSGTAAATIANNAVTNVKAADMANATIKGRTTAGTGDPEDLTATQAKAILDTVSTPSCRVFNNAAISIPTGAFTYLTFNSELWDNAAMHSTSVNTERITFPTAGIYLVGGVVEYAANATGIRDIFIRLNGTTFITSVAYGPASTGQTEMECATVYSFAASDYIELGVFQNTAGALNVTSVAHYTPEFYAVRLGTV